MWSRKFWADLAERSVKAALWALLGTLGADATGTLTGVDWIGALNVAGYALVIAVVANVLGTKVAGLGAENSASFLPEKIDPPRPSPPQESGRPLGSGRHPHRRAPGRPRTCSPRDQVTADAP